MLQRACMRAPVPDGLPRRFDVCVVSALTWGLSLGPLSPLGVTPLGLRPDLAFGHARHHSPGGWRVAPLAQDEFVHVIAGATQSGYRSI